MIVLVLVLVLVVNDIPISPLTPVVLEFKTRKIGSDSEEKESLFAQSVSSPLSPIAEKLIESDNPASFVSSSSVLSLQPPSSKFSPSVLVQGSFPRFPPSPEIAQGVAVNETSEVLFRYCHDGKRAKVVKISKRIGKDFADDLFQAFSDISLYQKDQHGQNKSIVWFSFMVIRM